MKITLVRSVATAAMAGYLLVNSFAFGEQESSKSPVRPVVRKKANPILLSKEHLHAVNRQRRIIDYPGFFVPYRIGSPKEWIDFQFSLLDKGPVQVDSILWCLDEGNVAYCKSKVLPEHVEECMKPWFDAGVDAYQVMVEQTHKRGLEAIFAHRINGFDRSLDDVPFEQPVKKAHPDWLIPGGWIPTGMWNFAVPGAQDYKVAVFREIVEKYDFDGVFIDFSRHPPSLPIGQQWAYRDGMTNFVRKVRLMLQEVAHNRERPLLLSVRVPSSVPGCHFDGLDIETWVRENLIDMIMAGTRSIDVDLASFRRITAGTHVKLYPSIDDAHSPDGYKRPPIEFFRGLCANWWKQGADGIVAWNVWDVTSEAAVAAGVGAAPPVHEHIFHEVGDPQELRFKDKMFVIPVGTAPGGKNAGNRIKT